MILVGLAWSQELAPEVEEGAEIVVEARVASPHASRQILDRERVEKVPGTHDDPFRLIQALPGVASTPEYSPVAGDLAIRGADPTETRVFLDGVEIPYLYHFQQYSSVLHTRLLDELAVYPSTFGAGFGDTVGAVIDVTSRAPDAERVRGGVNGNFVMLGGYLQAPVSDDGAVSASGRRSYLDLGESGNDQYTLWPVFWDYLGRYEHQLGATRVALTAFGGGDRYGRYAGDAALLDPIEQEDNPEFVFDRGFHAVTVRADTQLDAARLQGSYGLVGDRWLGTLPEASQDRRERYAVVREELLWAGRHTLSAGVESKVTWLSAEVDTDRAWSELEREAPLLARGLTTQFDATRLQAGAWAEPRLAFGRLSVQPGARLQVDQATQDVAVDPRVQAELEPLPDLKARVAAGRYTQAPLLEDLYDAELGAQNLNDAGLVEVPYFEPTVSDQVAAGVDVLLLGRLELAAEGYVKRFDGAILRAPGEAPVAVDGQAVGVELSTRYRMRDLFFAWVSLTLGKAERGGAPFAYDQPFVLSTVASWDFRPQWNAGVRYRYAAGLPFTPVDGATYDGDSDSWLPVLGDVNSERLPNYSKLDLHLERGFDLRRARIVTYLEAWYVPAAGNVLYPAYSYDYSESAFVAGPPFVPLFGARIDLL